ncbi:MAG: S-layer homology domain-containing protein [Schwartzia sp.]|nr:S-layer homology domain-containing protein [Schwartzia sp. (in: firmicutes)]MBR1885831.1 S-layer homology domain-containing protein [Schwartzia sp. (in: firmicutes)]
MKKSLVSALTTALVVGAASTTFAAANPFEDVPADHWAYDAIAQLAADGVVEGYGDGTYRGNQEITRYEMAQMIARAMAKGANGADKALIDKLAAEFADELNNLGIRVSALEKKVDNVKWYGLFRYTYARERENNDGANGNLNHQNTNNFRLRLQMAAEINKNWTGHARVEYATNGKNMDSAANSNGNDIYLNRAYVEGKYGNFTIDLGRFPYFTDVDGGMVFDDEFSGGMLTIGKGANVKLMVGRYHDNYSRNPLSYRDWVTDPDNPDGYTTASYQGIELNSDPNKKFTFGAAYHRFATRDLKANRLNTAVVKAYNADAMNIWEIGLGYRFDKNAKLSGAFARNSSGDSDTKYRQAWNVQFDYKGADRAKQGSWGAFVAYRHLGHYAAVFPTYNSMFTGSKGVNFGITYVPLKNIKTYLEYYVGRNLVNDRRQDTVFGRVELYF